MSTEYAKAHPDEEERHCVKCDEFCCTCELCRCCTHKIFEVERLRALITAWADADDALVALFGTDAAWDTVNAAEKRSDAALDALRKAVGR